MKHDWLKIGSITCFVIAGCLFASEPIKTHLVNSYQPRITQQSIRHHGHISYNMSKVKSASMQQVVNARLHSKQVAVAGQIAVPADGVHLPVNLGVSNPALLLGAGTMTAGEKMGQSNYSLAGHHMINKSALFTPLWYHAHNGTRIYLTDMKRVYTYRVYKRKIISPYDVGVVNATQRPILTLITCNDSGSRRLLLRGKLTNVKRYHDVPKALRDYFHADTNNHDVLKGY